MDDAPDAVLAAIFDGLPPGERLRAGRFLREADRRAFLAGRLLVQTALGRLGLSGRIQAEAGRKPSLAGPGGTPMPDFSLSHSGGWAALAIGGARAVGVDVEPDDRQVDVLAVAQRVVDREELARLQALPPGARLRRFLEGWTVREAWAKALGEGLSADLRRVGLDGAGLAIEAPGGEAWSLGLFRPEPGLLLGLALHHPGRPPPDLAAMRLTWPGGAGRLAHVAMSLVACSRSATAARWSSPRSPSRVSTAAEEDWT